MNNDSLLNVNIAARSMLAEASARLRAILQEEHIAEETPLEATDAMEFAIDAIDAVIAQMKACRPTGKKPAIPPGGPTHQQGQFLAFIREYMMRNHAGVAPTHANFQQYFNLTAPSVNSMLVRLEKRGFIRRIPHQARGIELIITPDRIPPLERPLRRM